MRNTTTTKGYTILNTSTILSYKFILDIRMFTRNFA